MGFFGTLHCMELQQLNLVGYDNPCHAIVQEMAKKLEDLLANRGAFPSINAGQLSS